MIYCLDTNICIYAINNKRPAVARKILSHSPERFGIASMVRAELMVGALKSNSMEKTLKAVNAFLQPFVTLPFGEKEAIVYARIRSALELQGKCIGPNDLVIAATALAYGAVLVTNNVKEFGRVEGLTIEDWSKESG